MIKEISVIGLIILIIAIYSYKKLIVVEDKLEHFWHGSYNIYGVKKKMEKKYCLCVNNG